MQNLISLTKEIENLPQYEQLAFIKEQLPNLNDDIIYYFIYRHLGSEDVYNEFQNLDLRKCVVEEQLIPNDKVFEIDYADFCDFKHEDLLWYNKMKVVAPWYFTTGTWAGPILVTPRNGKLVVIDGNNRLRMLRCYLTHCKKPIRKYHSIYVLTQSD